VNHIVPPWIFFTLGVGLDFAAFVAVLTWYLRREKRSA
jgi:hypothetical protein